MTPTPPPPESGVTWFSARGCRVQHSPRRSDPVGDAIWTMCGLWLWAGKTTGKPHCQRCERLIRMAKESK